MKKLIAKAILLIVCFQFAWVARAQYATEFYLTDLDNAPLKEKVQQAIGKLLTEINTAQANNSQPYFSYRLFFIVYKKIWNQITPCPL